MAQPIGDAVARFLATLKPDDRQRSQAELLRLARWFGSERDAAALTGPEVASYAEGIGENVTDGPARVDAVRRFLVYLHKSQITEGNLSKHVPVRRAPQKKRRAGGAATAVAQAPDETHLTPEGHAALLRELEELKEKRLHVAAELKRAMADKDFRENAPLDAARDAQGHLERRIRDIEAMLKRAVVVDRSSIDGEAAHVGTTVVLRNLQSGAEVRYSLVGPNEVNPRAGKISIESPLGRAVLQRRRGEEIEVQAPSGIQRFRIESIETTRAT
jgi:transcription elongation factor GreA